MKNFRRAVLSVILAAGATALLYSQNPGLQRIIVNRADLSVPGREAVIAHIELAPDARAGWHRHPGEEVSYILEGKGELLIDGRPTLELKPGVGFVVPAGARHDAHNTGTTPLKLVAVYVVEKGKPIASPAP
jgi:quercetin dioxygenase-like cupin family protein